MNNRLPKKLRDKLQSRQQSNALRRLPNANDWVDFSSNDYLGLSRSKYIYDQTLSMLTHSGVHQNGATGSRLLSGNHQLYTLLEDFLCEYHESESALIFNSGYNANVGFFSSVPQRGDIVFYDELIHASIRDGIQMGRAKAYKFAHNDFLDLAQKIDRVATSGDIYVVTESVFSMDGDQADLKGLVALSIEKVFRVIVDEAHAVGVLGQGKGFVQELGIQDHVFARIITFGKAIGAHGAAILGSEALVTYLVNFARSFIYTTALSPHAVATIHEAYRFLAKKGETSIASLLENISFFKQEIDRLGMQDAFIKSDSAIHCMIVSGNDRVKEAAVIIQNAGFDVKPILSPTVPIGRERIRFCIHSYNSQQEITAVLEILARFTHAK